MATPFSNINMTAMNRKQVQTAAKLVNVNPVIINQNTPKATLISAVKAR